MLFQLPIQGLTPVSLLESKLGFDLVTQLADRRTAIFTSIVYEGSNPNEKN
jgi:hypothetical protein